jgi:hypothetical protein
MVNVIVSRFRSESVFLYLIIFAIQYTGTETGPPSRPIYSGVMNLAAG